ncbi:S8 family peptidase, partial [Actinomadura rubrisoli]|uniref:S8 family peptidase n=1 Tax=Actinomadura rubrisoli TaxID=2530368 RepID=UPI0014048D19
VGGAAAAGTGAGTAAGPARTITLITGDKVRLRGDRVNVTPGPGRARVGFRVSTVGGHQYVLPGDAVRPVSDGRVDARLFDVTRLADWRYDDAHRADVPIIVEHARGVRAAPLAGFKVRRSLPALGLDTATVPKKDASAAWRAVAGLRDRGAAKLWLDGKRRVLLDKSVPQIGAPAAWGKGLTGKGVTVAVLDTGYDAGHPDLKGVVERSRGFTEAGPEDVADKAGHGTHVASTVAGSGAASGGRYKGVAPDARLAVGKVLGDDGSGTDSGILAGMEWAATEARAKVISMSLGASDDDGIDPVEKAVNELSDRTGVLFTVAAGNGGPDSRTVESPGSADAALTVGAVDGQNRMADFSSRGPRHLDGAVKPEITAPGVNITAARAGGGTADPYVAESGTSMATPHVAGAAAILAQRHPDWPGARLKAALIGSAAPTAGATALDQGAGRVDVAKVVAAGVVPETGNVSTYLRWSPHPAPVTRQVGYFNATDEPVTLKLALQVDQEAGRGAFRLAAETLTVPAGKTASADLRITGEGVAAGAYSGTVTATAAGVSVRTVVGALVEPKSHDLVVKLTDAAGRPSDGGIWLQPDDLSSEAELLNFRDGAATVRRPDGPYRLLGSLDTEAGSQDGQIMVFPLVRLDADTTVTLDARQAKRLSTTIDDRSAKLGEYHDSALEYRRDGRMTRFTLFGPGALGKYGVLPLKAPGLGYYNHTYWDKPGTGGARTARFEAYDYRRGELPADPSSAVRTADMAKVTQVVKAQGRPTSGYLDVMADMPAVNAGGGFARPVQVPSVEELYVTSNPDFRWWSGLLFGQDETGDIRGPVRTWVRGRTNTETWNAAVIAPSVAGVFNRQRAAFAHRDGDEITVMGGWLFGDGALGHFGRDERADGTVKLLRDGKELATAPLQELELNAKVPAGTADYTVTASGTRQVADSPLSTRIDAAWRFRSGSTGKPAPLPLRSIRFAPQGLDDLNRARGGTSTTLPISVDAVPGTGPVKVESLKVWASTDELGTWKPLPLKRSGRGWTTQVPNPSQGSVSLRASMTDQAGNSVDETIVRAYLVG